MTETAPKMNGPASGKFIDSIDPDDPEYIREMQRPADIKEDMAQMDNRKRVSQIMRSEAFREELEQIVEEHLSTGPHPANLLALQQITDLLMPHARSGTLSRGAGPIIPINDARGVDSLNYSKPEKLLRCKLAACYRLIDLNGWSQGIYNHITVRLDQQHEHFLINPYGLLYSEVSASTLVKVNIGGDIVEPGSTILGINKAGYTLHSAIHQARPDIYCIIHIHVPSVVAVSSMKSGLLPLSQEALIIGNVSYHNYHGIVINADEREVLARNLGPNNKVMFLRNHGVVACGATIEEAYHYATTVVYACENQMVALQAGMENLILVEDEAVKKQVSIVGNKGGGGVDTSGRRFKTGELEFEAMLRLLDNSGYRTGCHYHSHNLGASKKDRCNSEVELPPASSNFGSCFDADGSPIKDLLERHKKQKKAGWLNSPNVYTRQEIDEIGTPTPKKITKWVQEDGSPGSISMKIESPNQFAPQGDNPKEFKQQQKKIRKDYYEERVHAGPQSKLLEGSTWEEAQLMKDGTLSGTNDQVIVIGAASKGIIQRDHQHNAVVYKSYYAPNPFENMSADEIEAYKLDVQKKTKGVSEDDLQPGPDGHLISTEERMQQLQQRGDDSGRQDPVLSTSYETNIDDVINGMEEPTSPISVGIRTSDEKMTDDPTIFVTSRTPQRAVETSREVQGFQIPNKTSRDVPRIRRDPVSYNSNEFSVLANAPEIIRSQSVSEVRKTKDTVIDHPVYRSKDTETGNKRFYRPKEARIDVATVKNSKETIIDAIFIKTHVSPNPRIAPQAVRRSKETLIDDVYIDKRNMSPQPKMETRIDVPVQRSESARHPERRPDMIDELQRRNMQRSKSDRRPYSGERSMNGEGDKPSSPTKSDTMRSTDSASGGDTLDDHSSKEGSPTKDHPSPSKDKKKKKKFRMPSFSKKKKDKETA